MNWEPLIIGLAAFLSGTETLAAELEGFRANGKLSRWKLTGGIAGILAGVSVLFFGL